MKNNKIILKLQPPQEERELYLEWFKYWLKSLELAYRLDFIENIKNNNKFKKVLRRAIGKLADVDLETLKQGFEESVKKLEYFFKVEFNDDELIIELHPYLEALEETIQSDWKLRMLSGSLKKEIVERIKRNGFIKIEELRL